MNRGKANGWLTLCVGVLAIAIVWTLVLPWIGTQQPVRTKIDYLDRRGVDPAALYYTDLEAMQRIEADLAEKSRRHPDALWRISADPSRR